MKLYQIKTTYDKNRKEFDHKGYRCCQDDVWAQLEIPTSLLPEAEYKEDI